MSLNYTGTGPLITTLLGRIEDHVYKKAPYTDPALEDIDASNDCALECLHVTLKAAHEAMMQTVYRRQAEYYSTIKDK